MAPSPQTSARLDRLALSLSALCGIHCVATSLLVGVGMLASISGFLESPLVHEIGLVIAILLGALALGMGAARHRRRGPILIGALGLSIMASALTLPHGLAEAIATIMGLIVLSMAHIANSRVIVLDEPHRD